MITALKLSGFSFYPSYNSNRFFEITELVPGEKRYQFPKDVCVKFLINPKISKANVIKS